MAWLFKFKNCNFRLSEDDQMSCNGGVQLRLKATDRDTFIFFLERPYLPLNFEQIYANKMDSCTANETARAQNKNTVEGRVSRIRKLITTVSDGQVQGEEILTTQRGTGYTWKVPATHTRVTEEESQKVARKTQLEQQANTVLYSLIDDLECILGDKSFFHRMGNVRLPFFFMDKERFGFPTFPIPIGDTNLDEPNRGYDSLLRMRRYVQGKKIYPGSIYRLVCAKPAGWELAKTIYPYILDDCDYLAFNIKSGWRDAYERNAGGKDFLAASEVVEEWKKRVRQVQRGDFSGYHAGIAFSIPIFQIMEDGSLRLQMAKGSSEKAAGAGAKHVVPAGMLEFCGELDFKNTELTFPAFVSYIGKELIEETLLANLHIKDAAKRRFDQVASSHHLISSCESPNGKPGDATDVKSLNSDIKTLLDDWDNRWKDTPPSATPLRKIMELQSCNEETPCFCIVDAFNLRPEFIIPLYIKEDLDFCINWEYDKKTFDRQPLRSMDEVVSFVSEGYKDWAAPGIAAAYFGAKYYFENLQSKS
jgi:hypothetical protein